MAKDKRSSATPAAGGMRGEPADDMLANLERQHPGIEEEIGVSSAALRAGRMVREMRKAKGLTQTQLAMKLGWDQERISNIERGEGSRGPTFDVLQKIAAVCDHDVTFAPREESWVGKYVKLIEQPLKEFGKGWLIPEPQPQFLTACSSFLSDVGADMPVHVQVFDTAAQTAPSAKFGPKPGLAKIPCVEVTTHGKRMVMLPISIGDDPKPAGAKGGDLDVVQLKLYPNR